FPRRTEVPGQNFCFADAIVIEEPICAFGVGAVLTRQRKAPSRFCCQAVEQRAKPLPEALISEIAAGKFAIKPCCCQLRIGHNSPPAHSNRFARHAAPCGSCTRITYISYSRNNCKNNL